MIVRPTGSARLPYPFVTCLPLPAVGWCALFACKQPEGCTLYHSRGPLCTQMRVHEGQFWICICAPVHLPPPHATRRGGTQLPCLRKPHVCHPFALSPFAHKSMGRGAPLLYLHAACCSCVTFVREKETPSSSCTTLHSSISFAWKQEQGRKRVGSFCAAIRIHFVNRKPGGTRFRHCEPVHVPFCAKTHAAPVRVLLLCTNGGRGHKQGATCLPIAGGGGRALTTGNEPVQKRNQEKEEGKDDWGPPMHSQ
ncbi:hypothetical protein EDB83DRAFT_2359930 [Lactarius deliciosus]|nr:hypothetical protein EDB83DRAFT_2359930 [Lactarius deliciosus]